MNPNVTDPSGLVPLVHKVEWLRQPGAKTTDPHVLVTWVKKSDGDVPSCGTSFTVRTSRTGSGRVRRCGGSLPTSFTGRASRPGSGRDLCSTTVWVARPKERRAWQGRRPRSSLRSGTCHPPNLGISGRLPRPIPWAERTKGLRPSKTRLHAGRTPGGDHDHPHPGGLGFRGIGGRSRDGARGEDARHDPEDSQRHYEEVRVVQDPTVADQYPTWIQHAASGRRPTGGAPRPDANGNARSRDRHYATAHADSIQSERPAGTVADVQQSLGTAPGRECERGSRVPLHDRHALDPGRAVRSSVIRRSATPTTTASRSFSMVGAIRFSSSVGRPISATPIYRRMLPPRPQTIVPATRCWRRKTRLPPGPRSVRLGSG